MITESEMKPTRAGTGQYLQLVWEIIDGPHGSEDLGSLELVNPTQRPCRSRSKTSRRSAAQLAWTR